MVAALALTFASATLAGAQTNSTNEDIWNSVRQLTHRNSFTFLLRDQSCLTGEIKKVTNRAVIVRPMSAPAVTIREENVSRIILGSWFDTPSFPYRSMITIVYSGRSSWSDVMQLGSPVAKLPMRKTPLTVITKTGHTYSGDLRRATDDELSLIVNGKETAVSKADIARVTLLQLKPLTSAGEYSWDELGPMVVFDPELYPRLFHLGDTMPVRIYDSALPEDNSAITCKP